jgi:hypothetical protein
MQGPRMKGTSMNAVDITPQGKVLYCREWKPGVRHLTHVINRASSSPLRVIAPADLQDRTRLAEVTSSEPPATGQTKRDGN